MRALLEGYPAALATPWELAQECEFGLDFRKIRFPGYPVPAGETPFSHLYQLCQRGGQAALSPDHASGRQAACNGSLT